MNTATRASLDAIPIPVDQHGLLRACVVSAPAGYQVAWMHDGGRHKEPFGPVYTRPREAAAAALHLNERGQS